MTLIYGARYDIYTPFTEAHNHISNYDYLGTLSNPAAATSSALKIAGVNGVSDTAGIARQYNNVAPRVGFAYSLSPATVIRGGYGISYFPGNYTSNGDLKNAPFTSVYAPASPPWPFSLGPPRAFSPARTLIAQLKINPESSRPPWRFRHLLPRAQLSLRI